MVPAVKDGQDLPDFAKLRKNWSLVTELIEKHRVFAAQSIGVGGIAAAVSKMVLGNGVGFKFTQPMKKERLFVPDYGAILLEVAESETLNERLKNAGFQLIGETTAGPSVVCDDTVIMLADIETAYTKPLEKIFPTQVKQYSKDRAMDMTYRQGNVIKNQIKIAKPKVFIPVFPGTNCEYDSARAWQRAGAETSKALRQRTSSCCRADSVAVMNRTVPASLLRPCSAIPASRKKCINCSLNGMV